MKEAAICNTMTFISCMVVLISAALSSHLDKELGKKNKYSNILDNIGACSIVCVLIFVSMTQVFLAW